MATFGERFKQLRLELRLTQQELVDDFNKKYHYTFGKSAISQYENNKRIPEIDALRCFSEYFTVSLDYLLGKSDTKNSTDDKNKIETKAYHNLDVDGLPEEAIKQVEEYIELIKLKYNPDGTLKKKD